MKLKKLTALVLLTSTLLIGVSGCGNSYTPGEVHSDHESSYSQVNDPMIKSIWYICCDRGGHEYTPPVAGSELNVHCTVNDAYKDDPADMTLYIFKNSMRLFWNPDKAVAKLESRYYDYDPDYIHFQGYLPKDMDSADYTFVVSRSDKFEIDSVFTQTIVGDVSESEELLSVDKPVIYLYPEQETECYINIDLEGEFTCTYPEYNNEYGWHVTARPDGRLTDIEGGRDYDYLYWEGRCDIPDSFDQAVCVRGTETREFLEEYLEAAGLNYSEINDFITYWLPLMECNEYNLISFPEAEYEDMAQLNISPSPDNVIRVYMVFTALDEEVDIPAEDQLVFPETPDRSGFTVVEWGGSQV